MTLNHCNVVVPWVIDFSVSPQKLCLEEADGWRDLTKTKFRLLRGDEQLDFTFASTGPEHPHHVSNIPISELTFFMYFARQRSIAELRRVVRQNFEPNEYPVSIERLYSWTPDECVPEFYTDPEIFSSMHKDVGMEDLAVPDWASAVDDCHPSRAHAFIKLHREAFESLRVSAYLHLWM